jgi:hypothetical protein
MRWVMNVTIPTLCSCLTRESSSGYRTSVLRSLCHSGVGTEENRPADNYIKINEFSPCGFFRKWPSCANQWRYCRMN